MTEIVTRFAPSPTGHLHIGGARTALFCWAFARKQGGRFMIRIEDTDQARSSDESARGILEDLAWLGIEWDDGPALKVVAPRQRTIGGESRPVGPYFQAQRLHLYNAYLEDLVKRGKAYPAFETAEELEAKRKAAVAAKQTYRYDRASFHSIATPEARLARMREADAKKEPYVIRFFAPHEEVVVRDQVLGEVRYAAGEMDDFVIRKADGFPTYHFAVVIDDELMGVTHVLRAQEHLNNTPRHVAMQKQLVRLDNAQPFRTPVYGHLPLINNMDGSKMSKRDKAKAARKAAKDAMAKAQQAASPAGSFQPAAWTSSLAAAAKLDSKALSDFIAAENDSLDIAEALAHHFKIALPEIEVWDFRENGYFPEVIVNFLSLLGWNPGMKTPDGKDLEKFDMAFIAQHFSIDRIGKSGAKFDRAKLLAFNADAIAAMNDEEFTRRWIEWCRVYEPTIPQRLGEERMLRAARAVKPRCKTLRDAVRPIAFLLTGDEELAFDPAAVDKALRGEGGAGAALLREARRVLAGLPAFQPADIEAAINALAERKGVKIGPVAQAIRVALTGTTVSPGLGDTISLLGRESALRRIDRCLAVVGS